MTKTASPRIDIEALTSPAIHALEHRSDQLQTELADIRTEARTEAERLTKQEIITHLRRAADEIAPKHVEIPPAKATHNATYSEFVEAYVIVEVDNSMQAKHLKRLRAAADADRVMAERINFLLDSAERDLAEFRKALDENPSNAMKWGADSLAIAEMVADNLAPIAQAVSRKVDPYDIRKAAEKLARSALQRLAQFPRYVLSNGLGATGKAERLYEAAAAQEILAAVREAYGDLYDADTIRIGVGYI